MWSVRSRPAALRRRQQPAQHTTGYVSSDAASRPRACTVAGAPIFESPGRILPLAVGNCRGSRVPPRRQTPLRWWLGAWRGPCGGDGERSHSICRPILHVHTFWRPRWPSQRDDAAALLLTCELRMCVLAAVLLGCEAARSLLLHACCMSIVIEHRGSELAHELSDSVGSSWVKESDGTTTATGF